jgi:nitrite reductase/ring-hydroxylating ferredoxin subunit
LIPDKSPAEIAMHSWHQWPGAPEAGTILCRADEVPDGGAREVSFAAQDDTFRILLLRRGDSIRAYRNCCPHFSIPLNYEAGLFHVFYGEILMCAPHTAMFRVEDGVCYDGPCTGAKLEAIPLTRDAELVRIG